MGITSCFVEFIGAMVASTGFSDECVKEAEMAGFANDTCGYHRAITGASLKGIMPEPNLLIGSTCPCSGGLAVMENLAQRGRILINSKTFKCRSDSEGIGKHRETPR